MRQGTAQGGVVGQGMKTGQKTGIVIGQGGCQQISRGGLLRDRGLS